MLTILVSVLLLVNGYFAYPFPGLNIAQRNALDCAPGAQQPTSSREILEVVWSCLATTISCTWIAIHPNLHFYGNLTWIERILRRLYLMVLALLVPEIMVVWAYKQYLTSGEICENINKDISTPIYIEWTKTHAHFLQMGGFRLRCSKEDKDRYNDNLLFHYELEDGTWEGVLTYSAYMYFVKNRILEWPRISVEEIQDKSKGDPLFKALAILQLLWFIMQMVVRASFHLNVTNIELTTSILAAAAIFMYWCWWDKPLGIEYPVTLYLPEPTSPSMTHFDSSSRFDRNEYVWIENPEVQSQARLESMDRYFSSYRPAAAPVSKRRVWHYLFKFFYAFTWRTIGRPASSFVWHIFAGPIWALSCKLESNTKISASMRLLSPGYRRSIVTIFYASYVDTLTRRARAMVIFGVVFGGVHCAAWTYPFPTRFEQTAWRIAACIITGFFGILAATGVITRIVRRKEEADGKKEEGSSARDQSSQVDGRSLVSRIGILIAYYVALTAVLLYCAARVAILILAIASLRKLPPTALQTVNWLNLIPHL